MNCFYYLFYDVLKKLLKEKILTVAQKVKAKSFKGKKILLKINFKEKIVYSNIFRSRLFFLGLLLKNFFLNMSSSSALSWKIHGYCKSFSQQ